MNEERKRTGPIHVICFVSIRAKFGICTVVGLSGTKTLKLKCAHNVRILASKSVPFRTTPVQLPNLALIETKRITALAKLNWRKLALQYMYICITEQRKKQDQEREGVEPPV
jgi:hypothetical protein